MQRKTRTPSQIASEKSTKQKTSFSLKQKNLEKITELAHAAGVPVSELVDEAIEHYLLYIKENE